MAKTADEAEAVMKHGQTKSFALKISDLNPGTVFMIETLDRNHGFALEAWKQMGSPEPPTREQTRLLRETAMAVKKESVTVGADGILKMEIKLEPWSIACVAEIR